MMQFEWNAHKDRRNQLKHRVSFETAMLVFADPHALSLPDRIEGDEERWHTIGMAGGVLLLLVSHTYRGTEDDERVRIISARKATPRERQAYEENL
jgi:uncharacterized DUF497 family protein